MRSTFLQRATSRALVAALLYVLIVGAPGAYGAPRTGQPTSSAVEAECTSQAGGLYTLIQETALWAIAVGLAYFGIEEWGVVGAGWVFSDVLWEGLVVPLGDSIELVFHQMSGEAPTRTATFRINYTVNVWGYDNAFCQGIGCACWSDFDCPELKCNTDHAYNAPDPDSPWICELPWAT